jgi:hypothetical protein
MGPDTPIWFSAKSLRISLLNSTTFFMAKAWWGSGGEEVLCGGYIVGPSYMDARTTPYAHTVKPSLIVFRLKQTTHPHQLTHKRSTRNLPMHATNVEDPDNRGRNASN